MCGFNSYFNKDINPDHNSISDKFNLVEHTVILKPKLLLFFFSF